VRLKHELKAMVKKYGNNPQNPTKTKPIVDTRQFQHHDIFLKTRRI
jgi:hypothetical protein